MSDVIESRLFMVALVKDSRGRICAYRVVDRVTRRIQNLTPKQLSGDLATHRVIFTQNNESYLIENLHTYQGKNGLVLRGGVSGQTSKYPVISENGVLLPDKLGLTNATNKQRLTLLSKYGKKWYKFADYNGNFVYRTAQEIYWGVCRDKYALTNAKLVDRKGQIPIISLLYGNLVQEADMPTASVPEPQKSKTPQPQVKALEQPKKVSAATKQGTLNGSALVDAIKYVKGKMEANGDKITILDYIGIALMYNKVSSVEELKDAEKYNSVVKTAKECEARKLNFSALSGRVSNTLFAP